jgi:ATP-dependent RNA helicase DDX60
VEQSGSKSSCWLRALSCPLLTEFLMTCDLTSLDCSGLSATVGMPEKFNAWLETVQKAKGFEHKFIHHPHRYSHLRKFAYFPQLLDKDKPFLGLDGGRSSNEMMRFIHPISTLSFAGTMPPDLSLESSDLLRLYRVLLSQKVAGVERLDPNIVFSRDTFIRQKDVLRYEAEIKNVLARLVDAPDALDSSSPLQKVVQEVQDPVLKEIPKSQLNAPPSFSVLLSGLIHLLTDMQASDGLVRLETSCSSSARNNTLRSPRFCSTSIVTNV